jgi:tryptophanyl-tRNA synthetase
MLFDKIMEHFKEARDAYFELMAHPEKIDEILWVGAQKASKIAQTVLTRIKPLVGF